MEINNPIVLSNYNIKYIENNIRISCDVSSDLDLPKTLWFSIDKEGLEISDLNENLNWALMSILIPAMINNKDIYIDGIVSKRLLFNMNRSIQAFLHEFEQDFKIVKIKSTETISSCLKNNNRFVGTGFSSGIDSFATLLDNSDKTDSPFKVTHACVFNVGAFGKFYREGATDFFNKSSSRCKSFSKKNSYQSIIVNSNIDKFYSSSYGFAYSHTLRNIASAMLFDGYLSHYIYSSGYAPSILLKTEPSHDIAFLDPTLVPLLSTESIEFISTGSHLSRQQKIELVSTSDDAKELLDCCSGSLEIRSKIDFANCNKCKKCVRTITVLDSLGKLEEFNKVFDVEFYKKNKSKFHAEIKARAIFGNPRDIEVVEKSKNNNYIISGNVFVNINFFIKNKIFASIQNILLSNTKKVKQKFKKRKKNIF